MQSEEKRIASGDDRAVARRSRCMGLLISACVMLAVCGACGNKSPYIPQEPEPLSSLTGGGGGVAGSGGTVADAGGGAAGNGGTSGAGGSGVGGSGGTAGNQCSDPATNPAASLKVVNNWTEHTLVVYLVSPSCAIVNPVWAAYPSSITIQGELYDVYQIKDDYNSALIKTVRLEAPDTTVTIP